MINTFSFFITSVVTRESMSTDGQFAIVTSLIARDHTKMICIRFRRLAILLLLKYINTYI